MNLGRADVGGEHLSETRGEQRNALTVTAADVDAQLQRTSVLPKVQQMFSDRSSKAKICSWFHDEVRRLLHPRLVESSNIE